MISIKSLLSLAVVGATAVSATIIPPVGNHLPGCGEVNVFFTGLPGYHPIVVDMGLDPAMVDGAIRNDTAKMVAAGYNVKVALAGPEQDNSVVEQQMYSHEWDGTGVGFGMRGSNRPELTVRFEDVLQMYRNLAPRAPIVFNYNAMTFLWAVQRRLPLASNCTDSPGELLGFDVYCDICEQ